MVRRVARGGVGMWWWIWNAACNFSAGWWVDGWQGSDLFVTIISFFMMSRRSGIPGARTAAKITS